jgi:hypothetical protein
MTEAKWLAATRPYDLIYHPKCRSERKRRLFACACARRVLHFLPDARFAEVVIGCEEYADGRTDWKAVLALRKVVRTAAGDLQAAGGLEHQHHAAHAVGALTAKEFMHFKMASETAGHAVGAFSRPAFMEGCAAEAAEQLLLARDIFSNPFRPITFIESWRTDTAIALARTMYDSREFSAMPILADALQDAGCDNEDVLNHCRDPRQIHIRGCWVVDLVLGKS